MSQTTSSAESVPDSGSQSSSDSKHLSDPDLPHSSPLTLVTFKVEVAKQSLLWTKTEVDLTKKVLAQALTYPLPVDSTAKKLTLIVAVTLADDAYIQQLNASYRNKDAPTNVLSFPLYQPYPPVEKAIFGEIVVAHQTVKKEASQFQVNFAAYLTRILVHGVLHLFGYDHQTAKETQLMTRVEREILAPLGCEELV